MAFSPDIARPTSIGFPYRLRQGNGGDLGGIESKATPRKEKLTDWSIKALEPESKRYMVWDLGMPHLAIRVTEKGAKCFVVVGRKAGQDYPHFEVLGRYPALPLKAAREQVPEPRWRHC